MTENILITDDEKEIADLLEAYLKDGDYNIFKAYDGKTALELYGARRYRLRCWI